MIDRPAPDHTAPHGHRETSGEQVGAYTLLAIVGQGGAGTVWRARRCEPFEQIVALKILKPGMTPKPSSRASIRNDKRWRASIIRRSRVPLPLKVDLTSGVPARG